MSIYHATRTDEVDYDEYSDVIVRAKNKHEAREMCLRDYSGVYYGFTANNIKVTKIKPSGDSVVILDVFNAG